MEHPHHFKPESNLWAMVVFTAVTMAGKMLNIVAVNDVFSTAASVASICACIMTCYIGFRTVKKLNRDEQKNKGNT